MVFIALVTLSYSYGWEYNNHGYIDIDVNKDFSLIYGGSGNAILGDFLATGNSVLDGDKSTTYFAESTPVAISDNPEITNLGDRIDNRNSSAATLRLPNYVNPSHIVWAGLFWQGQIHGTAWTTTEVETKVNGWNSVHLLTPDNTLHTITAPIGSNTQAHSTYHYAYVRGGQFRYFYQAYVDVTDIIKNGGIQPSTDNQVVVGNVMATPGFDETSYMYFSHINEPDGEWYSGIHMGHFGGWSLVVVYNVDLTTYNNHPNDFSFHNISIYNGFDQFLTWGNGANIPFETTIGLSGFKTPRGGTINSKLLFFGGGGDYGMDHDTLQIENGNKPGHYVELTNFRNQGTQKFNGTYTYFDTDIDPDKSYFQGMDLDIFDTSNMMAHDQTHTNIKFGVVKMQNYCDQVFPQVLAFSTEIFVPKFCYDYAYKQHNRYFTEENNGSKNPRLVGHNLDRDSDIGMEIMVRNMERSDIVASNMRVSVLDVNTSVVKYHCGTTYITDPGSILRHPADDNVTSNCSDENRTGIPIGDVDSQQFFFLDYGLTPTVNKSRFDINMSINIRLDYELHLNDNANTVVPYSAKLGPTIPLCPPDDNIYNPDYSIFNVEDAGISNESRQRYNLPTQVVGRFGDFIIASYDPQNVLDRKRVSSIVSIELIDTTKYHNLDAACNDPDSATGVRVWMPFGDRGAADGRTSQINFGTQELQQAINDGRVSDQIIGQTTILNSPGDFFNLAKESAAFRISYLSNNNGDVLDATPVPCHPGSGTCWQINNFPDLTNYDAGSGPGNCVLDIDGNPNSRDKIPQYCGNSGVGSGSALTGTEFATCMECIYGRNVHYMCSRDNFSIRPVSYRMDLSDQNQSNLAQKKFITQNDNVTRWNLAAGYTYDLDVNATRPGIDGGVPGYTTSFALPGGSGREHFATLAWDGSPNGGMCQDTSDTNLTLHFDDGILWSTDHNMTLSNVGNYRLKIIDRFWTRYDHDLTLMHHHRSKIINGSQTDVRNYFYQGSDCIPNSSIISTSSTQYTNGSLSRGNGCDINSTHNSPNYTDLYLRSQPYKFDLNSVNFITNHNSWLYMGDLSDSIAMAVRMEGNVTARGADGTRLSNYTNSCAANDLDLWVEGNMTAESLTPDENISAGKSSTADGMDLQEVLVDRDNSISPYTVDTDNNLTLEKNNFLSGDRNGTAHLDIYLNFDKNYTQPVNPVNVYFKNLKASSSNSWSYTDLSDHYVPEGNRTVDQNRTFYYAKVAPTIGTDGRQIFTPQTSTSTAIRVDVFCQNSVAVTCGVPVEMSATPEEGNWYRMVGHNSSSGDGNISSITTVTPGVTINPSANILMDNNGSSGTITIAYPLSQPRPIHPVFLVTPDYWLRYDPVPSHNGIPRFTLHFLNSGLKWKGSGQTGHVIETEPSTKPSKRLNW